MEPNTLLVKWPKSVKSIEPEIVIYQIVPSLILVLLQDIQKDTLEAFANLYKNFL
jgi:hypothetical protein